MNHLVDYFKKFKKKFFGFIKEFSADVLDNIKLVWFDKRIESLREDIELDQKFELGPDKNKIVEVIMMSEAHNIVSRRIRVREKRAIRRHGRHQGVAQHA